MRFSVTSRRPGGVGQPPARLRGTMENASTGQMRSSNHPPACGAGCARVRKSRFGVWPYGKAHSARPAGFRMRLSVECAFPHLGKRRATSRKSALYSRRNRNSVHKCLKTAPKSRCRRSVYTLCPHGRSCDWVGPRVPQRRWPHGPMMPGRSDLRLTLRRQRNHQPIRVHEAKRHCLHMGGGTFALPGVPLAARCPRMSQARYTQDA